MRILAIDPGKRVGIVIWEPNIPRISHTIYDQDQSLEYMREVAQGGCGIFHYVGIEMIGHYGSGMPAGKDIFDTCVFIGRVIEILKSYGPILIQRREIKIHFCGNMRAKDGNIRQALIDRFGPPGVKKSPGILYGIKGDEWQALALGIYIGDIMASKPVKE